MNPNNPLRFAAPLAALVLLLAGCSKQPETAQQEAQKSAPPPAQEAPQPVEPAKPAETPKSAESPEPANAKTFKVRFETSKGPITVEVHRDWAPIGAERFEQLVKAGFYNGARFFRIVPRFIVQFGLAADPKMTRKWDTRIKDDPVKEKNLPGTLTFATAGPGTRTAQLFINLGNNASLDAQGFAPFGMVIEGMDIVPTLYAGYGEQPDQGQITEQGNVYLVHAFPKLDFIKKAAVQ